MFGKSLPDGIKREKEGGSRARRIHDLVTAGANAAVCADRMVPADDPASTASYRPGEHRGDHSRLPGSSQTWGIKKISGGK